MTEADKERLEAWKEELIENKEKLLNEIGVATEKVSNARIKLSTARKIHAESLKKKKEIPLVEGIEEADAIYKVFIRPLEIALEQSEDESLKIYKDKMVEVTAIEAIIAKI